MARERERFEAVRNSRLKSSAAAVSSVVASTSSSHGVFTAPRKLFQKSVTEASESRKNNSKPLKVQTKQDVAPTKVQKSSEYYYHASLISECFLTFTCAIYQSLSAFASQEEVTLIERRL